MTRAFSAPNFCVHSCSQAASRVSVTPPPSEYRVPMNGMKTWATSSSVHGAGRIPTRLNSVGSFALPASMEPITSLMPSA
jgi:hypothetical protein